MGFKPTSETAVGNINRSRIIYSLEAVPFKSSSDADSAITRDDLTGGTVAVALFTDGKVTNLPTAQDCTRQEILGFVEWVSSDVTDANSQDVPDVVGIVCHSSVFACKYDTAQAPAIGDRVVLTTTSGHYGEVRIAPAVTSDTDFAEGVPAFRQNIVIDIDTDNLEVLVLLL